MANKSFVVQYLIRARDAFSSNAKKAANAFDRLDDKAKKAGRQFNKTSTAFVGGFKSMAVAAIGFFSAREFIQEGSAFQDALADLSSITGSTGKDLAYLRDESLRLGKAAVISQSQVATAFKLIASAKSDLLEDLTGLSKVTEQVLLLANASGIDLTVAANTTTQALNQFGAGADQAARFVNVLAAGAKIGASEVAETGVAIIKSGAVAKQVGVSFEELNSAIQVLAKGGIKAEVAGTGLKTALLRLERTGLKRIMPSVVGLSTALENLGKMNLTTTQQQKLFGDEAIVIGSILSQNASLVREWTGALTGTSTAQEQAAIRLDTFNKKAQRLKLVFTDAVIRAFLRLEPVLSKNVEQLSEFMSQIDPKQIEAFAEAMGVVLGAFKVVGFLLKEVLGLLKGIGTIIGQVAGAIATLDFGQFNLKDAFRIGSAELFGTSKVDVGVQVGLDQGLTQTAKPVTSGAGVRRADVGLATAGG